MVKQTKKQIADEIHITNENRTTTVLDYATQKPSNSNIYKKESIYNDDLIGSLAEAYENKRARQVFEWEIMRRKNIQKSI